MKIAVYHNVPPGGARRTVLEQIRELSRRHIVDLYLTSPIYSNIMDPSKFTKNVYNYEFNLDIHPKGIKSRLIRDCKNFIALQYLHKKIANDIDKRGYDFALIHSDEFTEAPFVLRYINNTPTIYHCHEPLRIAYEKQFAFNEKVTLIKYYYEIITRYFRKQIDFTNTRSASSIITSSLFIRNKIKEIYNIEGNICYAGVDSSVFFPCAKKTNQVLFIGNKNNSEGYNFAKDILHKIPSDIRPKLKVLDFKNRQLNISNDNSLAREYSRSIATLCLDYDEPFGLKAIESMSCETPVLAVNEGGYKESVEHNITGYLLDRNVDVFSNHLMKLLENQNLVKNMGNKGRKCVQDKWRWDSHVKKIENVARKLIHQDWD